MAAQSLFILLSSSLTYRAPCNPFDTFLYRDLSFLCHFSFYLNYFPLLALSFSLFRSFPFPSLPYSLFLAHTFLAGSGLSLPSLSLLSFPLRPFFCLFSALPLPSLCPSFPLLTLSIFFSFSSACSFPFPFLAVHVYAHCDGPQR